MIKRKIMYRTQVMETIRIQIPADKMSHFFNLTGVSGAGSGASQFFECQTCTIILRRGKGLRRKTQLYSGHTLLDQFQNKLFSVHYCGAIYLIPLIICFTIYYIKVLTLHCQIIFVSWSLRARIL